MATIGAAEKTTAVGELLPLERARELVLAAAAPLGSEPIPLSNALGRVLAADATSDSNVPAFDNSAMDGFAIRAADTAGAKAGRPAVLRLAGESRAGAPSDSPLADGEAIRISTGAMVPDGADAVLRKEDALEEGDRILATAEVSPGRDVRRAGDDIRAGETVLRAGTMIGPAELGVLASLGIAEPACARRPRSFLVTTGEELIEPGEVPFPGSIRNTNARTVGAQLLGAGCELAGIETVGDDRAATVEVIRRGLSCDLLVVCGGVSVGAHDHVKGAFADLGVEEVFWGVAVRPGRPTWFGHIERANGSRALVFGLPGNPVSAMVIFHLLARPAAAAMLGADERAARIRVRMAERYEKRTGRAHAVRCRLEAAEEGWRARPTGDQGSHVLTSMLGADGLVTIPAESAGVEEGELVELEPFEPLSAAVREAIPPPTRTAPHH